MTRSQSCFFACFLALLFSSCNSDDADFTQIQKIVFPSDPIEIASNTDLNMQFINYFNIIKVKGDLYYMYYQAIGRDVTWNSVWDQSLYFAYSRDGFHWTYEKPNGGDNKLMSNVIETSVFVIPGDEYPFRLIGNVLRKKGKGFLYSQSYYLCMWKSKDGVIFENPLLLMYGHDTQNCMIVYEGYLKLFTREWMSREKPEGKREVFNRKISTCKFDYNGLQLTPLKTLYPDYVYNSAVSYYQGNEVFFPTYFNNIDGDPDSCYIKNYVITDGQMRELECEFNIHLEDNEKWAIVSPGLIEIGDKLFISYNTRTESHDSDEKGSLISKYKLIEVEFK